MFYILVVLYKKNLQSSDTLKSLLNSSAILKKTGSLVFIWDNSPVSYLSNSERDELKLNFDFTYFHCPENKPLSYIYNQAIEKVISSDKYKYLVLFDDDSNMDAGYFEELLQIAESNKNADIILPQAKNNGKIISPAQLFFVKGKYFDHIEGGIYKGSLLAVNSGMIIATKFIRNTGFRYSNKLLNYGTDNYLMNFANKKKANFYIMNSSFQHGYSFYDTTDIKRKAEIFKQIKKANKIAFSSTPVQSVLISFYNLLSSVKNAVKYKSIRFLN